LIGPRARSMFQSPLHRGTLFNRGGNHRYDQLSNVSVPSSSGNSLQLKRK